MSLNEMCRIRTSDLLTEILRLTWTRTSEVEGTLSIVIPVMITKTMAILNHTVISLTSRTITT